MRNLLSDTQSASINLFDAFQESLGELCEKDAPLFSKAKSKAAISHKLAMYIEEHLRKKGLTYDGFSFDVMLGHADIVLHDRKDKVLMTIMVFHDYIPGKEIDLLKKRKADGALLTLAVAFLTGKEYILIYRVGKKRIEYYHYNREENLSSLCMAKERMEKQDNGQLSLLKTPAKRGRKERKESK